jgi:hypothetical protein
MPVIIIVADGARPDTLASAMDAGALPELARLRAEGGAHEVTSVFPSVTGPAYAPFLAGRFPAPAGLPALRWFDRERATASYPHYTRSYVGHEMRHVDRDLDPRSPTIFELAAPALGALSVIRRGLPRQSRVGAGLRFALRAARTHFTGNVAGWLAIDRAIGAEVVRRTSEERPRAVFAALTGIDKTSHAAGHEAPIVREAMRIVDEVVGELRAAAVAEGWWDDTHLWIVSDHGHSPVREHEDLDRFVASLGWRVVAHPWVFRRRPDVAVMVSGNAMAHLYVELERRERPWWGTLAVKWNPLVEALLERESVDLVLLPHAGGRCEIRSRRGTAVVEQRGDRFTYLPGDGDPLGIGEMRGVSGDDAWDATSASDYPDSLVQIAHLAGAPRVGDIVLSGARGWDFRARYEPIPHRSSHGALHREHMMVPLLANRRPSRQPRRTTDVFPSALAALGIPAPGGLDGRSFL